MVVTAVEIGTDVVPAGMLGVIVTLAGLFIRNMTQDRGAGFDMAKANAGRIETLESQVAALLADNEVQHKDKHAALNRLTRALSAVDMASLVTQQAISSLDKCDCDELEVVRAALIPIAQILDRLHAEAVGDPNEGAPNG